MAVAVVMVIARMLLSVPSVSEAGPSFFFCTRHPCQLSVAVVVAAPSGVDKSAGWLRARVLLVSMARTEVHAHRGVWLARASLLGVYLCMYVVWWYTWSASGRSRSPTWSKRPWPPLGVGAC